jgi:cytochrome c oxidase subunit 2
MTQGSATADRVAAVLNSRHTGPLALITLVVGAITVAQAVLIDWLPEEAGEEAARIDWLLWFLFWVSAAIFVLVTVVLIYCIWAFRAKPGDESDGPPIHGNTRLEVVWTMIPVALLAVVAILSIIVLEENEAFAADRVKVEVIGEQFVWRMQYPDAGVESGDLRVPVDRQVELTMRASDVIHSFWVPAMRVKQDAVPGITTDLVFTPDKVGTYEVVCAELCGAGHGVMRTRAIVMEPDAYEEWLAAAQAKVKADAEQEPATPAAGGGEAETAEEG